MSRILLWLAGCLLSLLLLLGIGLWLVIEGTPRISRQVVLTPEHIERAKKIVDLHRHRVRPGMLAIVRVLPGDADLAANYLVSRFAKGSARVELSDGSARVGVSLPVPGYLPDGYLNLDTMLATTAGGLPHPYSVSLGKLSVPDKLVDMLMPVVMQWLLSVPEYRTGLEMIQGVEFARSELSVTYLWKAGLSGNMQASVLGEEEQQRLLHYQTLLVEHSRRTGRIAVPLTDILTPLLQQAASRSAGSNAVAENRAAILAVTLHVLGKPPRFLIPKTVRWPRAVMQQVTLDGRDDFAKHFMVSATIAAYADTALSDAVGLYKEIEDARSGSGFSFSDIAADRAGTRFGERAAGNHTALPLQQRVAFGLKDTDLMPPWSDLPEFMSEAVFRKRFGGVNEPPYLDMMQKIEQRVAALTVLH
jgi:hypothetical protein